MHWDRLRARTTPEVGTSRRRAEEPTAPWSHGEPRAVVDQLVTFGLSAINRRLNLVRGHIRIAALEPLFQSVDACSQFLQLSERLYPGPLMPLRDFPALVLSALSADA